MKNFFLAMEFTGGVHLSRDQGQAMTSSSICKACNMNSSSLVVAYSYEHKLDLSSSKVHGLSPSPAGASLTLGRLKLAFVFAVAVLSLAGLRTSGDIVPSSSSKSLVTIAEMISVVFFVKKMKAARHFKIYSAMMFESNA